MKTKEERTDLVKAYEFTDDELASVSGGAGADNSRSVSLIGPYYADAYGGGGTQNRAIGWSGLTLGKVWSDGRAAPCEIKRNGTTIGWAPWNSISISEK